MKIIDLLNKIANNELEDTKFIYDGDYFKYWKHSKQIDRYRDSSYTKVEYKDDEILQVSNLNDEVEIIEEDKKIKKLKHAKEDDILVNGKSLLDKIDEIIDEVNKLI